MAVTRSDGVIHFAAANDVATEALDVRTIVFTGSGVTEEVVVKDGAAAATLFTVDVVTTGPVVIPFAGQHGKHFPKGLELDVSTAVTMTVFLA